jgi:hypothetical protein
MEPFPPLVLVPLTAPFPAFVVPATPTAPVFAIPPKYVIAGVEFIEITEELPLDAADPPLPTVIFNEEI